MVFIMARSISRSFYCSKAWEKCRANYLESVNHLCERCLAKGIYEPAEVVHHKIYLTKDNFGDAELMFGFDNLEALCAAHHNEEHKTVVKEKRWKFVDGELLTREI